MKNKHIMLPKKVKEMIKLLLFVAFGLLVNYGMYSLRTQFLSWEYDIFPFLRIVDMMAMEAMVDSQSIRTGDLQETDWEKIMESAGTIGRSPLIIDDTPGITIAELRSKCRRYKQIHGLDLIIIDYLQLMSGGKRSESRQQEISEISRSLKALAREMNAPVIALSQLSRRVEERKPAKPMLSDLRESGSIEQDADVVMFIYRDEYYNEDSEKKGIAEIIVDKQRNGSTGSVELVWLGQYTKFGNKERAPH